MESYADEIDGTAETVIITPWLCKELVFSVSVFHILTSDIRAAFFRSAQHAGNLPLTATRHTRSLLSLRRASTTVSSRGSCEVSDNKRWWSQAKRCLIKPIRLWACVRRGMGPSLKILLNRTKKGVTLFTHFFIMTGVFNLKNVILLCIFFVIFTSCQLED